MSSMRGWPTSRKPEDQAANHVTVEPTGVEQYGQTVNARVFVYQVASDTAETGSTTEIINATGHVAQVGDIVRFTSGVLTGRESKIVSVETNTIKVADVLPAAPANGNVFLIMRPRYPQVDVDGNLIVSTTPGPVQFVLDSVDTEVEQDTVTPANSRPLPVKVFRDNGTDDWADDVEANLQNIETSTQSIALDIDTLEANFGGAADLAASSDTGTFTFMAFVKRMQQQLTTLNAKDFATDTELQSVDSWLDQLAAVFGLQSDSAASSDTGTFSFMAFVKRSLQKLTLINSDTTSIAADAGTIAVDTTAMAASLDAIDDTVQTQGSGATNQFIQVGGVASGNAHRWQVNASGHGQVSVADPLPAGTNNIGDVDVLTLPVNTAGNIVNDALSGTTAQSEAAPANAVGFILFADDDNENPIRFCIGSTASTSVGLKLAPGRDSGYIPCTGTISICATASGTNEYALQWILTA